MIRSSIAGGEGGGGAVLITNNVRLDIYAVILLAPIQYFKRWIALSDG